MLSSASSLSASWRLPVVERAQIAEPGKTPGRVVVRHEVGHRGADLGGGAEDAAVNGLLLEGAKEPLDHAIGLRLMRERMAERHAPMGELVGEVAGGVLRPVVGAHGDAARGIGARSRRSVG